MTLQPPSLSERTSPVTAAGKPGGTPARQVTEPIREVSALALLAGNAVFLLLGVSRLLFVLDGWSSSFGQRCTDAFPTFVGLLSLGLPMASLLVATHIKPMVLRSRQILLTVLIEYAVSAVFGAVTFLGAFAHGLNSARATIEGILQRGVWLAFLILVCVVAVRIQLRLFPRPKPAPYAAGYLPTSYGQPYPGQPMFPQTYPPQRPAGGGSPASTSGDPYATQTTVPQTSVPQTSVPQTTVPQATVPQTVAAQNTAARATSGSGWPAVPPPPMPAPLVVDPLVIDPPTVDPDPTTRIALPVPATGEPADEATQVVKAPEPSTAETHVTGAHD